MKEFGKVQRAVLGIRMQELTPESAKQMKLKESSGIYVGSVISGEQRQKLVSGKEMLSVNQWL
ncbi:MAG: hypothetical protein V8S95_08205 [Odoribacter sp.]